MNALRGYGSCYGIIYIRGRKAGLVLVLESGALKNALHAVMLDRGPLWFEGYGSIDDFRSFMTAFNKTFPKRLGRRRRIIPEFKDDNGDISAVLSSSGFKKRSGSLYETIWLDLDQDEGVLRKNLKKRWRQALQKAENSALQIEWDQDGKFLPWLLGVYSKDKAEKNYEGSSAKLITAMASYAVPGKDILIGRAVLDGRYVGAILILCHGCAATYQIGWTSRAGRTYNAHHLLLLKAFRVLKDRGIQDLDLGGIHDSIPGIKRFKEGMGGESVQLAGLYI